MAKKRRPIPGGSRVGVAARWLALTLVLLVLGAVPARAAVFGAAAPHFPSVVAVNQPFPAQLGIGNFSTLPESLLFPMVPVTEIDLVPACADAGPDCGAVEAGVFSLGSSATGTSGPPSCLGTWAVTEIRSGVFRFVPPRGEGSLWLRTGDVCVVDYTATALRIPATDVTGQPDVQTNQVAGASVTTVVTARHSNVDTTTVVAAGPAIATRAVAHAWVGQALSDTATLSGAQAPAGTITFALYGPADPLCSEAPVFTSAAPVSGNRDYVSASFTPAVPGTYRWVAAYGGDDQNAFATNQCNDPGAVTLVRQSGPIVDYDGDARADPAMFRPETGTWFVHRSARGDAVEAYGGSTDLAVPGDYDGDARMDLAVYRPETGTWFVHRSTGGDTVQPYGAPADVPVPADYDGDGRTDVAVFRPGTGMWFVHRSTGGERAEPFGASGDVPVPADYDGDGSADLAVYRPGTGGWFVLHSSGGQTTARHGTATDIPVPADYDGDGRADLAVYRPGTGAWFVLRSSGGLTAQTYGTDADVPVPADYDGDGRTDLAVFRPGTSAWFISRTSDGDVSQVFGLASDVVAAVPAAIRALL